MDTVSTTAFWSGMGIVGSAIGASFLLSVSHSSEPKHADAAFENDVTRIEIKLERVATDVEYNKSLLGDLKEDIRDLRDEQTQASESILEAIRSNGD
ncbi:hypothetical protein CMI37_28255 [Candidatus Pacearchaeota archaeon]|nr:hypothetical protein [Candidatus Pacearchaeota archaeon]|tara:strand:+ start:2033 stop:2323 length:291 start_codon:yes stop_codon:yes gene_type:complete